MLRTKKAITEAFSRENHSLRFVLHDLTLIPISVGSRQACEILAFFRVDTIWPDGSSNQVLQRIQLTWCLQAGEPRIRVCYISNAISYDNRDFIYPVHYAESHRKMSLAGEAPSKRLSFRGPNKSLIYLNRDHILCIETSGRHTILHTIDDDFESPESLSTIERRYPDDLIRCHQSYLINPDRVTQIRRFELQLTGGTVLPNPEKKYTAVKAMIQK